MDVCEIAWMQTTLRSGEGRRDGVGIGVGGFVGGHGEKLWEMAKGL